MTLHWIKGTVTAKKLWSEGLFTISVLCPGVEIFEPGQFLQLGLMLPEHHLHRPYSVASPSSPTLEFFIVRVDGGQLTPRLYNIEIGESIDVSQRAAGSFTLSHALARQTIYLVATGTGLAPYIAMLREETIWKKYERVILLHGVRHRTDLAYQEEIARLKDEWGSRFEFLAAVSRDDIVGTYRGRLTTALADGTLESLSGSKIDSDTSLFMLCGNPDMLSEMESMLHARGLMRQTPKHPGQIVVERYW